jgi:DNA processing protein
VLPTILRILHTPKIGVLKFWQLWDHFVDVEKISLWLREQGYVMPTEEWAKQHLATHAKHKVRILHFLDPAFPALLKHISGCPPILYCKGDLALVDKPMIGIVGARGASVPMIHFIKRLSSDLGKAGYVIVSGLAAGIDTAAHLGAMTAGTIGICAGGVDQVYPQQNGQLYKDVGLLISEMPFGTKPVGYLFPKRNRIIAGLAAGIVVAEAGFQSGSLITGQCAVEFNREVFVVPGSPLDTRSRGGNKLIKEGAYLIENAEDITRILRTKGIEAPAVIDRVISDKVRSAAEPASQATKLSSCLSHIPLSLDDLQQQTNLPMDSIRKELARLEIQGCVTYSPNGQIILKD